MNQYRHEWKHRLSPADLPALRQRLNAVLRPDIHAQDGFYTVRSLYFDTLQDTALREKLDGVSRREKFRIRYYNFDPAVIHLEKKSKNGSLGTKQTAAVTAAEVQDILQGQTSWMLQDARPLVRELYCKIKTTGLRPKTIVDYTREPFVYPAGSVRVTLDYHIRTGLRSTDFFDRDCPTVPVGEDPVLMEVKWDGFLPDIIANIVQTDHRQASAYSKYAACRAYD